MSFKWFRMLLSPHNGQLQQIGLRRTAPQSKTISKPKQSSRTTVQQHNLKLELIKRNMALMDELTQPKAPNRMSKSSHQLNISSIGKSRASSRCYIRSGSNSTWNLRPSLLSVQNGPKGLTKKINTIERFYTTSMQNKKESGEHLPAGSATSMKIGGIGKKFVQSAGVSDMNAGFLTRPMPGGNTQVRGITNWQKPIFPTPLSKNGSFLSPFRPSSNMQLVKNTIKSGLSGYARKCLVASFQELSTKAESKSKSNSAKGSHYLRKTSKAVDLVTKDMEPDLVSAKPMTRRYPYDIQSACAFTKIKDTREIIFGDESEEKAKDQSLPNTSGKNAENMYKLKTLSKPTFHLERNHDTGKLEIKELNMSQIKKKMESVGDVCLPAIRMEKNIQDEYLDDLTTAKSFYDLENSQQGPSELKPENSETQLLAAKSEMEMVSVMPLQRSLRALRPVQKPVIKCSRLRMTMLDEEPKLIWQKERQVRRLLPRCSTGGGTALKGVIPNMAVSQVSQTRLSHTNVSDIPSSGSVDPFVTSKNQPYQSFGEIAKQRQLFEYIPRAKPRMKITYPMYYPNGPLNLEHRPSTWLRAFKAIQKTDITGDVTSLKSDGFSGSLPVSGKKNRITGFLPQSHSPTIRSRNSKDFGGAKQLFAQKAKKKQMAVSHNVKKPFSVSTENLFKTNLKKNGLKMYGMRQLSSTNVKSRKGSQSKTPSTSGSVARKSDTVEATKDDVLSSFKDVKSTKVSPCQDCGLFHIASSKGKCPVSEWMKTTEPINMATSVGVNNVFKRDFSTTTSKRRKNLFPNKTEELLNVCKYCGIVHSGIGHQCPMSEAVKLFTPAKKKVVPFKVIQPSILNKMPNKVEVLKRAKNVKDNLCVFKPLKMMDNVREQLECIASRAAQKEDGLKAIRKRYRKTRISATMKALYLTKKKNNRQLGLLLHDCIKDGDDVSVGEKIEDKSDGVSVQSMSASINENRKDIPECSDNLKGSASMNSTPLSTTEPFKHYCKPRNMFDCELFLPQRGKYSPTSLRLPSEENNMPMSNIDRSFMATKNATSSGSRGFNTYAARSATPAMSVPQKDKLYNGRNPKFIHRMKNKLASDEIGDDITCEYPIESPTTLDDYAKPAGLDKWVSFLSLADRVKSELKRNEGYTSLVPGLGLLNETVPKGRVPEFQVREQRRRSWIEKLRQHVSRFETDNHLVDDQRDPSAEASAFNERKSEPVLAKRILISFGNSEKNHTPKSTTRSEIFLNDPYTADRVTRESTKISPLKMTRVLGSHEMEILSQDRRSGEPPSRSFSTNKVTPRMSPSNSYRPGSNERRFSNRFFRGRFRQMPAIHTEGACTDCASVSGKSEYPRKLCNKEGIRNTILELMNIHDTTEFDLLQAKLRKHRNVGKPDEYYKFYVRDVKTETPPTCVVPPQPEPCEPEVLCEEFTESKCLSSKSDSICSKETEKTCSSGGSGSNYNAMDCKLDVPKQKSSGDNFILCDSNRNEMSLADQLPPIPEKERDVTEKIFVPADISENWALSEERESALLKAVKTRQQKEGPKKNQIDIFPDSKDSKYMKYYDEETHRKFKYLEKRSENLFEDYEDDPLYRIPLRRHKSTSDKDMMKNKNEGKIRKDQKERSKYKVLPNVTIHIPNEQRPRSSQASFSTKETVNQKFPPESPSSRVKADKYVMDKPSTVIVPEFVTEDCRTDSMKKAAANIRPNAIRMAEREKNKNRVFNMAEIEKEHELKDSEERTHLQTNPDKFDSMSAKEMSKSEFERNFEVSSTHSQKEPIFAEEVNENLPKLEHVLQDRVFVKDRHKDSPENDIPKPEKAPVQLTPQEPPEAPKLPDFKLVPKQQELAVPSPKEPLKLGPKEQGLSIQNLKKPTKLSSKPQEIAPKVNELKLDQKEPEISPIQEEPKQLDFKSAHISLKKVDDKRGKVPLKMVLIHIPPPPVPAVPKEDEVSKEPSIVLKEDNAKKVEALSKPDQKGEKGKDVEASSDVVSTASRDEKVEEKAPRDEFPPIPFYATSAVAREKTKDQSPVAAATITKENTNDQISVASSTNSNEKTVDNITIASSARTQEKTKDQISVGTADKLKGIEESAEKVLLSPEKSTGKGKDGQDIDQGSTLDTVSVVKDRDLDSVSQIDDGIKIKARPDVGKEVKSTSMEEYGSLGKSVHSSIGSETIKSSKKIHKDEIGALPKPVESPQQPLASAEMKRKNFVEKEVKKMEELSNKIKKNDDIRLYRLNSEEYLLRVKSSDKQRKLGPHDDRSNKKTIELKSSPKVVEIRNPTTITARVEPQVLLTVKEECPDPSGGRKLRDTVPKLDLSKYKRRTESKLQSVDRKPKELNITKNLKSTKISLDNIRPRKDSPREYVRPSSCSSARSSFEGKECEQYVRPSSCNGPRPTVHHQIQNAEFFRTSTGNLKEVGREELSYAGLTRSQIELVCENVLRDVETMQMLNHMRGVNLKPAAVPDTPQKRPEEVDQFAAITEARESLARIAVEKFRSREAETPSWKYLVHNPDVYQIKSQGSTQKISKCMEEVKRCLDDYKNCLVDMNLMPKMDEQFEYQKVGSSSQDLAARSERSEAGASVNSVTLLSPGKRSYKCSPRSSTSLFTQRSRHMSCSSVHRFHKHNNECIPIGKGNRTASDVSIKPSRSSVQDSRSKFIRKSIQIPNKHRGYHQAAYEATFVPHPTPIEQIKELIDPPSKQAEKIKEFVDMKHSIEHEGPTINLDYLFHSDSNGCDLFREVTVKPSQILRPLTPVDMNAVDENHVDSPTDVDMGHYCVTKESLTTLRKPHFADVKIPIKKKSTIVVDLDKSKENLKVGYAYTKLYKTPGQNHDNPIDFFQQVYENTSKKLKSIKLMQRSEAKAPKSSDEFWPVKFYPKAHSDDKGSNQITTDISQTILDINKNISQFFPETSEEPQTKSANNLILNHASVTFRPIGGHQNKEDSKDSDHNSDDQRSLTNILKEACLDLKKHTEKACQDLKKSFYRKPQKE